MTLVNGVHLFSNSEIQTFKDCPRKWWLAWYRGLVSKVKTVDGVRDTGTRVHVALAAWYVPEGDTPGDPIAELHRVQQEDLEVFLASFAGIEVDQDALKKLESQFDLEHAMVSGYLQWLAETGVDSMIEVIAPETYVEADFGYSNIDGLPVKLIGKLDARFRNRLTGRRLFNDLKTGDFPNGQLLRLNEQMLHYHVIEWFNTEHGEPRCDGALYTTLRRVKRTRASKPPYYQRVPIDHNIHQLQTYVRRLQIVTTKILEMRLELERRFVSESPSDIAYPRPSRDCTWKCDFFKICGMFDDGSRVEAAIEDNYVVRDPLDYYGGQQGETEITAG